jgi:hypothetical protein
MATSITYKCDACGTNVPSELSNEYKAFGKIYAMNHALSVEDTCEFDLCGNCLAIVVHAIREAVSKITLGKKE